MVNQLRATVSATQSQDWHLLCLQDPASELLKGKAGGFAAGQILYDAFVARYGNGTGGIIMLVIPAGSMFL